MFAQLRAWVMDVAPRIGRRWGGYHKYVPTQLFGFRMVMNRERDLRWVEGDQMVRCTELPNCWEASFITPKRIVRGEYESLNAALKRCYEMIVMAADESEMVGHPPSDEWGGSSPLE